MADVEFKDNSAAVKGLIGEKAIAFLYEAVAEIESQAAENTRVDTGKTKGAWSSIVDEENLEAVVGNTDQNAIREEFGTGEYALSGDGRKGGWRYMDAKGNWHYTKGKKPSRALHRAFESKKTVVINLAKEKMKEVGSD